MKTAGKIGVMAVGLAAGRALASSWRSRQSAPKYSEPPTLESWVHHNAPDLEERLGQLRQAAGNPHHSIEDLPPLSERLRRAAEAAEQDIEHLPGEELEQGAEEGLGSGE